MIRVNLYHPTPGAYWRRLVYAPRMKCLARRRRRPVRDDRVRVEFEAGQAIRELQAAFTRRIYLSTNARHTWAERKRAESLAALEPGRRHCTACREAFEEARALPMHDGPCGLRCVGSGAVEGESLAAARTRNAGVAELHDLGCPWCLRAAQRAPWRPKTPEATV